MGKYSKMVKGEKDKLARSSGENGGGQDAQNVLTIRVWGIKTNLLADYCASVSRLFESTSISSDRRAE
jgi:hypothetical protein